ncbi:rod shape-determining protein MreD [Endozoicomonas sp. (ex Bugula neritina AB1)]|nr:rod shape-determining protein MreD [Endozoicomonas sp. (ex Bugula neritina AB1)]
MSMQKTNAHWVVWMTLLVAALLSVISLPEWVSVGRPAFVPLVMMFWIQMLPERFGLLFGFLVGVLLDVFLGTFFGLSAMGMLLVAFVTSGLHRRLRMFPMWQQSFMVFVIIGCYQLLTLWVRSAIGQAAPSLWYLLPSVTSALIWPWLAFALRFLRRYFRVT